MGEKAGKHLVNLVLDLVYVGKLSAKDACLLCYWAHRAGATERVGRIGFHPGAQSGQYQRHLDTVLETKMRAEWNTVAVPVHHKHDASRQVRQVPVLLPYDEILTEIEASPTFAANLRDAVDDNELPDAYLTHPGRQGHKDGKLDVPIGLFVDAVPTINRDSTIGFFAYNIITKRRFLCAVLRKRNLCHCGCRGWCSYWAIWNFLTWAFTAFGRGVFPERKHDGSAWPHGLHSDRAGQPMPCRGLLVQIKADWAEWASTLGLTGHKTLLYPCVCCFATQSDWFDVDDLEFGQLPWAETSATDYSEACDLCEIPVTLANRQAHARVRGRLAFDRRKDGLRGRGMVDNLPEYGLLRGDRLEPTETCPDIGAHFDELASGPFPVTVVFWRRTQETMARHRCPLMSVPGVTVSTLMIDTLHCLFLGVVQRFLETSMWLCITCNVWQTSSAHAATRDELCVQRCRADLFQWYKTFRRAHPNVQVTELQDLTPGMLGTRLNPNFTPKGMEARWMVPFVNELLVRYKEKLPSQQADHLIASGASLENLIQTMNALLIRPDLPGCKVEL